ncbi:MAG: amidohydrolase [Gemmatimonadaceae bacterium]|nr:amidohydrolase [Gemmatimonadaceae bacterium]
MTQYRRMTPSPISAPRRRLGRVVALAGTAVLLAACADRTAKTVTLAIVNGHVWTGDSAKPWAEAVAVADHEIVAVGTSDEIRRMTGEARVIDAAGAMVTPGFIDSHVHFLDGGFALASVKLRDAKTKEEFIRRIAEFAKTAPAGAWIRNGDWDHTNWGGELPTHEWIDSVTPNNPVWINRLDGHMNLANALALAAAHVDRTTKDVAGGTIVRDAKGNPTGVLKDNAMSLVDAVQPPRSDAEADVALDSAMHYVASNGVTSVHHMGEMAHHAIFRRAASANRLITRIVAQVPLAQWAALRDTVKARGNGDSWLRIGGLKGFVDGSLGSHTAAMLAPFSDAPQDTGLFVTPPDSLYAWTKAADAAGLQVMVHAIGDRAIRTQLDIFDRVTKENGPRDRRFRIEHAQHIAPEDIARFAQIGVIASMQPYHAADDGRWADRVIGADRAKGSYAWKSLLDAKAALAFGSDWFVAPPTPLEGIKAAMTRRTLDGANPGGWVPEQRITLEQALTAYTKGSAYAGFQDTQLGIIAPGRLADLVVLDRDLSTSKAEEIDQARVRVTIVGGKVVFERK